MRNKKLCALGFEWVHFVLHNKLKLTKPIKMKWYISEQQQQKKWKPLAVNSRNIFLYHFPKQTHIFLMVCHINNFLFDFAFSVNHLYHPKKRLTHIFFPFAIKHSNSFGLKKKIKPVKIGGQNVRGQIVLVCMLI